MILGLTSSGAIKIKTDGGLRAVECACCGCDFTIEAAKTTTISQAYNFNISTPDFTGSFTVPIEFSGNPLLNFKEFCLGEYGPEFIEPCSEDENFIYYNVSISKFLTPKEEIPCEIDSYAWGGTWIEFGCDYDVSIAKNPGQTSFFYLGSATLTEITSIPDPDDCNNFSGGINWAHELRPCNPIDPSAGGLTAKQAYKGLFEGVDLWTPLVY
jgi:hypothetical protein